MSEENIKIWNDLKSVPAAAKKTIEAGRLKGMTDIKPQWRLQMMTERFGPIGIGWYYDPVERWTETYGTEISAHIRVNLFVRLTDGEWSKPISGTGGSMLIANEKIKDYEKDLYNTLMKPYHSDEAYKMATTDALGVAMKQLGVAADVYMGLSESKYDKPTEATTATSQSQPFNEYKKDNAKRITGKQKGTLRDLIISLDKLGTKSCNVAVTAINTFLGADSQRFEDAEHLINKCNGTLEKES